MKQFLDKNRDTLRGDVVQLLIQSKNALISRLFKELYDKEVSKSLHRTTAASAKLRTSSVANSFNESLQSLLDTMSKWEGIYTNNSFINLEKLMISLGRMEHLVMYL